MALDMRAAKGLAFALVAWCQFNEAAEAEQMIIEDFSEGAAGWRVITDQVMGGVSEGRAVLREQAGDTYLELSGTVSTANNGGFVQARFDLTEALPETSSALHLRVKGNAQQYFIHLRQRGASRPWHYYQAAFDAETDWQEITMRFSDFRPSSDGLAPQINPADVASIALAAYGRDHEALVALSVVAVD
ncbi:MAG: CIA30 family protein [Pseudomonadota bacterium]